MEIRSLGGRDHSSYYSNARLVRRSKAESEGQRIEEESEGQRVAQEAAAPAKTVPFAARKKKP
jgi:hypothetical protein